MKTITANQRQRRADALRNESKVREAADTVFRRYGKDLSMDDVAREAGVSKGTVYNVFGSRDELIEGLTIAYLRAATLSYRKAMESEDLWQGLADAVLTPTMGIAATADLMAPGGSDCPARTAFDECRRTLDELLDLLKQRGLVRPEITTTQLTNLFRGLYQVLPSYGERDTAQALEHGWIILRGIRC
ncbi:transcriptional regulator, TetR family [Sphingobium faniae]|nr:transcriptional regulator, TetR family [Sphingobium faniae]